VIAAALRRIGPRSLAGQLALLVGVALFVAQAINFALLLGERRERRATQLVAPAVVRLVRAADRFERGGLARRAGPRRVQVGPRSGVTAAMTRQPLIERRVAAALADAGVSALEVRAAEAPADETLRQPRAARRPPAARMLVLSVRMDADRWLTLRAPVRDGERVLVARLLGETAVLYALLLLSVLWIGRRAARPLHELAGAAAAFGGTAAPGPVAERGPADIRVLIRAFNAMRDRLVATLAEKDRMLGAIGHDLRTPLASLRLRAEAHDDPAERARMADTIAEMSQTLDDIMALAQVGRSHEAAVRVDLSALVDAIVEDLRDLGGDVAFEPSPRVPVALRPVSTRRAIRNLVENGLKYGGRVVVRVRTRGGAAIVQIDDAGPGLPPDQLERVFESFTRLEGSRNRDTGGAGLGLALARGIVRDQGGDIVLENLAPRGLRATLSLPAKYAEPTGADRRRPGRALGSDAIGRWPPLVP